MKLDHMVILLGDLEAHLPFYDALLPLLGFTRERDYVFGNEDGFFLDFRQAGQPEKGYERYAPGLNHMGFAAPGLERIEQIRGAMMAAGFEAPEVQKFPDGHAVFFRDPEGMRIEVGAYDGGDD
jgi:catechol 2,3-dioxygenase-like lactoylglutathione lyase family enzyme